ncbi:hypothetical protein EDD17DRAFT_507022 [Pisolithus thermaeus]|nr:hypothetical protein EDD17DRAFT_507022 [Pisolithus thermaeus]
MNGSFLSAHASMERSSIQTILALSRGNWHLKHRKRRVAPSFAGTARSANHCSRNRPACYKLGLSYSLLAVPRLCLAYKQTKQFLRLGWLPPLEPSVGILIKAESGDACTVPASDSVYVLLSFPECSIHASARKVYTSRLVRHAQQAEFHHSRTGLHPRTTPMFSPQWNYFTLDELLVDDVALLCTDDNGSVANLVTIRRPYSHFTTLTIICRR